MDIKIDKTIPIPPLFINEEPVDPDTGLRPTEEKVIDIVLNAPKGTQTKAVQAVMEEKGLSPGYNKASQLVSQLKKRKAVLKVLNEAAEEAEADIVEIAKYSKTLGKTGGKEGASYAGVALAANKEILDRVHGKSKQSLDVTTKSVTINMDLTQALPEASNG